MISFTYGEKIIKSSGNNNLEKQKTDESVESKESSNGVQVEYDIKGKEWFFVPDFAGEAASAVKMQILQIADLITTQ